ncbi:MAG: UDP-N-acetylmuramate--L-alanine ligase [Holosporales bacterium]|nr:UDP-N-acetylmuramate--L-alanine ligase [Holosporales bacterium]
MTSIQNRSLYFVGIGGIGMSGIAEILHNKGLVVRGSDVSENANVKRLACMGIPISIGHSSENIRGAHAVVVSSAIPPDNPELIAAKENNIPVITRGEMLAELIRAEKAIAVSGTHGKTTTTSLIAAVLNAADLDPTIINGGIINTYQANAKLGNGDWFVVEADESDGSFLRLPSTINVITNIDPEHMNYYQTEANLEQAFWQFIRNLPFYGLGVVCLDHPRVKRLFGKPAEGEPHSSLGHPERRIVTYGFDGSPHFKAENVRFLENGTMFDVAVTQGIPFASNPSLGAYKMQDLFLPMLGKHNVLNALAAVAVAKELEISADVIKSAFASFQGVKRRFTILGQTCGVTFVDDYAHHPMEIKAVIDAARQAHAARVVAVFQPHRYSRFTQFFDAFADVLAKADIVIALPVYAAGESPQSVQSSSQSIQASHQNTQSSHKSSHSSSQNTHSSRQSIHSPPQNIQSSPWDSSFPSKPFAQDYMGSDYAQHGPPLHEAFVAQLRARGVNAHFSSNEELSSLLQSLLVHGDFCIGLGAGNISELIAGIYASY